MVQQEYVPVTGIHSQNRYLHNQSFQEGAGTWRKELGTQLEDSYSCAAGVAPSHTNFKQIRNPSSTSSFYNMLF